MTDVGSLLQALQAGRISRRRFIIGAAQLGLSATAIGALLEACAQGQTTSGSNTPRSGGKLTIGYNENITNLDPHLQSGATFGTATINIWDALTGQDPVTLKVIPALATEWKVVDPTTITFTLRSGVKFHSGAPLTSADVKFSIERVQDPKTGSFWAPNLSDIGTVQTPDSSHVTMKLNKPLSVDALLDVMRDIRIVSEADGSSVGTKPNGTGPFKYVEWVKNDHLTLAKNGTYWDSGRPYVDQIVMRIISDPQAQIAALSTGDIDILSLVPLNLVQQVHGISGAQVLTAKQHFAFDVMDLNRTIFPFDNVHVRRMVMFAFDAKAYFAQFLGNEGVPQNIPFDTTSSLYNAQDAHYFDFNMDKAKQELAAAGYSSSNPLSFSMSTIASGFPEWENASVMLQASLKQLGVNTQIRKLELGTWVDELFKSKWTLTFDFLGGPDRDPYLTFLNAWALRPGTSFAGTTLPNYTDLLDRASRESDPSMRKADYQQAARDNLVQVYCGILGLRNSVAGARNYVRDYHANQGVQLKYVWRAS